MSYCDTSILIGIILLGGAVLSLPISHLRIVFKNFIISGSAGVVLIALGIIMGSLGFC